MEQLLIIESRNGLGWKGPEKQSSPTPLPWAGTRPTSFVFFLSEKHSSWMFGLSSSRIRMMTRICRVTVMLVVCSKSYREKEVVSR